jgi:hypothetical protein
MPGRATQATIAEDWTRWELGNLGLSIALPGKPTMRRFPLSNPAQQIVQDHMGYFYNNDRIAVCILYIFLRGGTEGEISRVPSIIASIAMASLAANPNISDVRSSTEQSGSKVILRASFKQDGIDKKLDGFILLRGRRLWSVVTAYAQGDDSGSASAQRVLDSAKLESK